MAGNQAFSEDDLRWAAGPMSYERGLGYLNRVEDLQVGGTWVTATVFGNDAYEVRLGFGDAGAGVRGECSCPFGAEGNFCKHCVATGLAALKLGAGLPERSQVALEASEQVDLLTSWLTSLTRDQLFTELLELISEYPELVSRFRLRAAVSRADVRAVRDVVRKLIRITDYAEYRESQDYALDVARAADAIEELIDAGAVAEAIEVARDAIDWVRTSYGMVDDSSGEVASAGYELLGVHLLACEAAPPDPVELAGYLADTWLTDEYELRPALTDYTKLLGEDGITELRERVAAALKAKPDDFRVRHVMESVLEAAGDVDALVALYAAHLDERGWQQLRIAQALDRHGRADEALDWAERGVRAGPRPDDRLVRYLASRYTAAGRAGDMLELRRLVFSGDRSLASYQALRDAAVESGVWDAERALALGALREDATVACQAVWPQWDQAGPVLVDALTDDGDLAAAWDAAKGIATKRQWIRLANASAAERPADALAVYVKVIDRLSQETGDSVYKQIATHLLAARACHEALGTMDKFRQYMMLLRMGQKRKRNLMKILEKNGL
jgi:uncharacterized Zn finger protein